MTIRTIVTTDQLTHNDCQLFDIALGQVLVYSTPAPYKRGDDDPNEDRLAVFELSDGSAVLVVADGVGGLPAGEVASSIVIDRIAERLAATDDVTQITATLIAALEDAHRQVRDNGSGGATTVALAHVEQGKYRTLHAGDSVVMQCGQRGKLKLETIAHSPVGYALEAGILSEDEAFEHEDRHVVSNVIGGQDLSITLGGLMPMALRDTLLIATDGVTDNLRQSEEIEIVRKGNLMTCGVQLAREGQARMSGDHKGGKPDDMSFILFRRKAQK